jgi:hypothetical protein
VVGEAWVLAAALVHDRLFLLCRNGVALAEAEELPGGIRLTRTGFRQLVLLSEEEEVEEVLGHGCWCHCLAGEEVLLVQPALVLPHFPAPSKTRQ